MDELMKKNIIYWVIGLVGTTLIMLILLITGETSLNFTLIIFMAAIKFLGGFGLIIGVLSIGIFILTKNPDKFKGKENYNKQNLFLVLMIILPAFFLIYNFIKIFQSASEHGTSDNFFDIIMYIYGIASLLLSLYTIPLIKGYFVKVTNITTGDMIKKGFQETKQNIKKKIFTLRKEYGKALLQDGLKTKEQIEILRQRLAVISMVILGIGSLVFTPISLIFIVCWLRIFFLTKYEFTEFETKLLIIGSIALIGISILEPFIITFTPFYQTIKNAYNIFNIFNVCGIILGSILYYNKFLKPRLNDWKNKRKQDKIEEMKKEQELLEQKNKQMKKEMKNLEKQKKQLEKQQEPISTKSTFEGVKETAEKNGKNKDSGKNTQDINETSKKKIFFKKKDNPEN